MPHAGTFAAAERLGHFFVITVIFQPGNVFGKGIVKHGSFGVDEGNAMLAAGIESLQGFRQRALLIELALLHLFHNIGANKRDFAERFLARKVDALLLDAVKKISARHQHGEQNDDAEAEKDLDGKGSVLHGYSL